ncbi:Helicase C-terminal [Penicillium expansum]|nr:Helicase C-terminal [Penicillium expansum]
MDRHVVLDWYNNLDSRVVDLVGDFVGDELFIIEGDSLLLECFSNEKLDFNPGFQVLHATYLVEKLLQKLQQRKCFFEVVFFDENASLCIPKGVHRDLHARYLLAREAIIQHLISVRVHPSRFFQALRFDSFQSDEFKAHLISSGAYLFMCHDGAFTEQNNDDAASDLDNSDSESDSDTSDLEDDDQKGSFVDKRGEISRFKLRAMIYWFVVHGYNLALLNSLEFRDTKVMAMVIESSIKTNPLSTGPETDGPNQLWNSLSQLEIEDSQDQAEDALEHEFNESSNQAQTDKLLEQVLLAKPELSQRQCLVVATLSSMLLGGVADNLENKIGAQSMLLHIVLLQNTQLSDRSIQTTAPKTLKFFNEFVKTAQALLSSKIREEINEGPQPTLRFRIVENLGIQTVISSTTQSAFNTLACLVDRICDTTLQCEAIVGAGAASEVTTHRSISKPHGFEKVLPFSNAVFDKLLKPVHLAIDESADAKNDSQVFKEFKEDSHWHSSRPLDQKKVILTPQEVERNHKRNQRFMAEMRDYAASLSGSQPEPIVVESSSGSRQKSHQNPSANREVGTHSTASKSDKKSNSKSGKPSTKEMAAAFVHQKAMEVTQKQRQKWKNMYNDEFALIGDLVTRFTRLNGYLISLPKDSRQVLEPEILTCMIDTLLRLLFVEHTSVQSKKHILVVTRIWEIVTCLVKIKQGISSDIVAYVSTACQILGLPAAQLHADSEQKLSFPSFKIPKAAPSMSIEMSSVEFQLLHGGPFMERSIDSLPDSRTPDFAPDRWQREVLDQIDAKKSAFIVAPTSAGKTFISFYAMRQILKEDNDGILVYVAPTKALVNQIAAEVQARFSKSFPAKTSGKSVWAIHTRDYRINNPQGCQILITVPQILQIMLLNPSNASAWTPRLRRIIFDEIHCIGQAEDGVVWEQLLLMSPCPIIALSATVGNPQEFYNWLDFAQRTNGFELKMIQHQHRYSDCERFASTPSLARLGLDGSDDMTFVHPVTSLLDRTRSIPDDLDFEPRDCFTLWKAMKDLQTKQFPVDPSLDPTVFFSNIVIQKVHVIEWQRQLKMLLGQWMKDQESPFEKLLRNLDHPTGFVVEKEKDLSKQVSRMNGLSDTLSGNLVDTTLPLISSLHAQNALPALFFNYDRGRCEDICQELLTQLQNAETKWKEESPVWKSKIAKWEVWKTSKLSAKKKLERATKKKTSGNADEEPTSKAEQAKESASTDFGWLDLFDPKRPVDGFHLADFKKVPASEFLVYSKQLQWRSVPQWLIDALERGIGVHHAGMNRKYRQVCEILFRKGFLRVVIATGTLALGINMPCKTVVFSGDSIFLTALNFRQAAGRAGRRGFDVLGNVVFQQVPPSKVQRLMSSRLPSLSGHFPITTSLVLRLFILLHGSKQAPSAVKSINSILSSSRMHLGGPEMKQTVLHHLRFSIEYLRRNNLLSSTGMALNFAGCISHLYYTENSSFAFHALLNSGYLQDLCQDIETKPKRTVHTLMLVMAHLFGRIPLRASTLEWFQNAERKPSSIVALPPLPRRAASALRAHNKQVLDIYTGYVSTFAKQHIKEPDCLLPFSGIKCGGESTSEKLGFSQFDHISPSIVSPFFALSGNGDQCNTIFELSQMVRSGVWIEDSVIPYVAADPNENAVPLNAYLYDFFKHGNVSQLETANRIRRGDIWFVLNDFSMTLATIKTSIEGFLKPGGNIGADMLDVTGGGDDYENLVDDKAVDQIEAENAGKLDVKLDNKQPIPAASLPTSRPRAKKVVMDSWEDEMDDEDDESEDEAISAAKDTAVTSKATQEKPVDNSHRSMFLVAKAFKELHNEFDTKFKAMWA